MLGDLSWLIVRLSGGFWAFREGVLRRPRGRLAKRVLKAIYYAYLHRYGAYIGHSAHFASEPCFPHNLHGIFIAGNAKIGRNCVLFQQVTIGANALPDSKGVGTPILGDNVYVGAGAKIIGAVKVGNNCRIGANCIVSCDAPDNSIVVLPRPELITRQSTQDNRYFRWSPNGPVYFEGGQWIIERDPNVISKLRDAF